MAFTLESNNTTIPKENKDTIFDQFNKFYTNPGSASGLGFAIAKRIILGHRGKIEIVANQSGGHLIKCIIPKQQSHDSPSLSKQL